MSWFWIVGIVLNVGLTVAAIVWVIRQGKPRNDPPTEGTAGRDTLRQDAGGDGALQGPKDPPANA
jgi:hypothetical protein